MKKCARIIFYSLIIAVFFCCIGNSKKEKAVEDKKEITTIPFEYHETFKLSEHASDSPTLKFDFSLSLIDAGDSIATDNINQAIAYTLFESRSNSIKEACEEFVALCKKEYYELLPDYIDSKENSLLRDKVTDEEIAAGMAKLPKID